MDFLNLPNWKVIAVRQNETQTQYLVEAEYTAPPRLCPNCFSKRIVRMGKRRAVFMDLPHHAKPTGIEVWRQRYKCKTCAKTFTPSLPDIDEKRDVTVRLLDWIIRECLKRRTYRSIAEATGVAPNMVMYIFRDYAATADNVYQPETPEWLGIDEIHLGGTPCCVLADVKERTFLDILRGRTRLMVTRRLGRMPERERVKVVAIDMWRDYRYAAEAALPNARIVIDKFHVVRLANQCMETVRVMVKKGLSKEMRQRLRRDKFLLRRRFHTLDDFERLRAEAWFADFPLLGEAHALKEGFYAIYDAPDAFEAKERYWTWLMSIPKALEIPFNPLVRAVKNWEPFVFAYFDLDVRVTNAYTESLNSLIRYINRIGRGYSFEVLRSKLLHAKDVRVYRTASFRRDEGAWSKLEVLPVSSDHGASMSTLARKMADGTF